MSVKNLFGKTSGKVLGNTSISSVGSEVESSDLIETTIEYNEKFDPLTDYSNPANFAKFGSAEKYYFDSIQSIYKTYPYDGSLNEKMRWNISSSGLTSYIFENEYPRNNGFINIGRGYGSTTTSSNSYDDTDAIEYIYFKGGPNTYISANSKKELFEKANKFKTEDNRQSNLEINGIKGNTIEFWFKKDNLNGSPKQVIFDLWNSSSQGNSDYGRFRVEVRPGLSGQQNSFYVEYSSGSSGVMDATLGTNLDFTTAWKHYAITAANYSGSLKLQLIVDKDINQQMVTGSSIGAISGSMIAQIGSLITSTKGGFGRRGWGKLSGSIDDFRYWKTKRTDKDISKYWFSQVGGGTNTDASNTDLGVYYKFNEGIFNKDSISTTDTTVLDYSGRITNGVWTGYTAGARSTGSAIVLSNAAETEFLDPVVYSNHPDVLALRTRLESSGSIYDRENNAAFYNSIPEHITDEDQDVGGNSIKELTQIMSEFFDNLFLKIEALPTIKEIAYRDGKQLPFAKRLLEGVGFQAPEILVNSTVLESFLTRNDTQNFSENINNTKNAIYQNIYNNLLYIYRSKGTEKSIRNLIRCFGIDDELIKINLYADGAKFTFDDRYQYVTERKKYINFNNVDRFDSTVYQMTQSNNPNSVSYMNGNIDTSFLGSTFETEAIFPKKFNLGEPFFFRTDFVSCSLFGMHEASNAPVDLTWVAGDRADIQVFAVRPEEESKNVSFLLTSSYFSTNLTTPLFYDVYNDQKWNFAVRLKHEKYPYSYSVSGSEMGNYLLEFYGVNAVQDIIQQEFILTSSIDKTLAENYFAANKRVYVGAHRTNFNGPVVTGRGLNNEHFSDAKISSVRYWNSYLNNDIIKLHSKDVFNFGSESPYGNIEPFMSSKLSGSFIPQSKTLALHWDFETVTGSDSGNPGNASNSDDASFTVLDVSSGSLDAVSKEFLGSTTYYQHTGKGDMFPRNNPSVVSREYVYSGRRRLPETLNNDDLTNILSTDDEYYERDTIPVNYYFAIEKSMYQNLSGEMLKWFGTIKDFNNLIGQPKNRYESEYRGLKKLRQLFFLNMDNTAEFERFVDFYKWIDDSITLIIQQLVPASMNVSEQMSNLVESHILERNKYRHKLPTLSFFGSPPIGAAKSIGELKYNWQKGSAPISRAQNENCDWWLQRAERTNNNLNSSRADILTVTLQTLNRKFSTVYDYSATPITIMSEKKRDINVLKGQVSYDIQGTDFFEITGSQVLFIKDCKDN